MVVYNVEIMGVGATGVEVLEEVEEGVEAGVEEEDEHTCRKIRTSF